MLLLCSPSPCQIFKAEVQPHAPAVVHLSAENWVKIILWLCDLSMFPCSYLSSDALVNWGVSSSVKCFGVDSSPEMHVLMRYFLFSKSHLWGKGFLQMEHAPTRATALRFCRNWPISLTLRTYFTRILWTGNTICNAKSNSDALDETSEFLSDSDMTCSSRRRTGLARRTEAGTAWWGSSIVTWVNKKSSLFQWTANSSRQGLSCSIMLSCFGQEADMAIADLTVTADRSTAVDFSYPFWTEPSAVAVRVRHPLSTLK